MLSKFRLFTVVRHSIYCTVRAEFHVARPLKKKSDGEELKEAVMRVLNVAEKNDAAKNIAKFLSRGTGRMREGLSVYNKIYEFDYNIFNQNCKMIMTSVSGHLLNYEFDMMHRSWKNCNPSELFTAPVFKQCNADMLNIKKTLEREIRTCNKLIIWTDCDREGENIGFEVIEVCRAIKPNVEVFRAKFSEITLQSIERALRTLAPPDERVNNAVNVRQELDLRIGAAFTRFQTMHLQMAFPEALGQNLISYGSCQFPTLGFVVERYKAIADFIAEPFWKVEVSHEKDNLKVDFHWKRVRLFDKLACSTLYDICKEHKTATVINVEMKRKTKWRPKPLDTVELEKSASRKLRINAKETMRIAERLYSQGFISYPRTETNIFPPELDLRPLVENQTNDPQWGEFARKVLNDGPNPFNGNKSDKAHPPIHPIKYTNGLNGNEKRIYEFIVRHFLACLSKHAEGLETCVDIQIAEEQFTGKGLMIEAKNYLEVYPYEKWDAKEIHIYQNGDIFEPAIDMTEGQTSPPNPLTEADLIGLMEKHGIGTDATHAEHIETIKTRLYVGLRDEKYFVPRTLGMGLVEGYDNMGFEMSKPNLRAELEADLKRICEGQARPDEVLARQIQKYKTVFESAQRQVDKLEASIQNYYNVAPQPVQQRPDFPANPIQKVKKCPKCNSDMIYKTHEEKKFVTCSQWPNCHEGFWFPNIVTGVTVTEDSCPTCGPDTKLLKFNFERGSVYLPQGHVACVGGCDENFLDILGIKHRVQPRRPAANPPNIPAAPQARPLRAAENFARPQSNFSTQSHNDSGYVSSNSSNNNNPGRSAGGDDSSTPNCNCGKPAIIFTVKKAGPNIGRQFYKCDERNNGTKCNYFQWADEMNRSSSSSSVESSFTRIRNEFRNDQNERVTNQQNDDDGIEKCYCALPCVKRTVSKEGANKGKTFFACSKGMTDPEKCNFFKWEDETEDDMANRFQISGSNNRSNNTFQGSKQSVKRPYNEKNPTGNAPKKRKCGLCGEEGHTRKTCPHK